MTGFEIEIFKSSMTVSDLLSFGTFKLHFYLSMCVCVCVCLHATSHTWRRDQLLGVSSLMHFVGPRNRTQIVRLGSSPDHHF